MTQIMEIDNKQQKEMKWINSLIHIRVDVAITHAVKHQNMGQGTVPCPLTQYTNSQTPYNCSNNTSASSSTTYPPRLTDDKWCLLHCNGHYNCTPDLGSLWCGRMWDLAGTINTRREGTRPLTSLGWLKHKDTSWYKHKMWNYLAPFVNRNTGKASWQADDKRGDLEDKWWLE